MAVIDLSARSYRVQVIKQKWRTQRYVLAYPRASPRGREIIAFCHVPFGMDSFRSLFYPGAEIPSASYCFTRGQSSSILLTKGNVNERMEWGRGYFRLSATGKCSRPFEVLIPPFFLFLYVSFSLRGLLTTLFFLSSPCAEAVARKCIFARYFFYSFVNISRSFSLIFWLVI